MQKLRKIVVLVPSRSLRYSTPSQTRSLGPLSRTTKFNTGKYTAEPALTPVLRVR